MKKTSLQHGFTLIELLVVITIIAILAGIALPVYSSIQERGQQTSALSKAKQIGLGLKLYASDYDGQYPGDGSIDPETSGALTGTEANDYLRVLVPGYVPSEAIFWVSGSGFCAKTQPDEVVTAADRLISGENHWAYVQGLSETSPPRWPLLVDSLSDVTAGTYSKDQKDAAGKNNPGGLWKGKKAIVIRADQSGSLENCNSSAQVFGPTGGTNTANILVGATGWFPAGALVNPTAAP